MLFMGLQYRLTIVGIFQTNTSYAIPELLGHVWGS